jgi:hypothetical protein
MVSYSACQVLFYLSKPCINVSSFDSHTSLVRSVVLSSHFTGTETGTCPSGNQAVCLQSLVLPGCTQLGVLWKDSGDGRRDNKRLWEIDKERKHDGL